MSTNTTPTKPTETKAAFTFDEQFVKDKFTKIEQEVNTKQGKAGYNPYVFLKEYKCIELQKQFSKGDRTEQLFNAIKSIPDVIPPVLPANIQAIDKAIKEIK